MMTEIKNTVISNFGSRTRQITGVEPGKTTENNICIFTIQIPQSLQQNGNNMHHPFYMKVMVKQSL
jgi:hypothetical protein